MALVKGRNIGGGFIRRHAQRAPRTASTIPAILGSASWAALRARTRQASDLRMMPSEEDLQVVGLQRRAGRGDVDDDVGRAGGRSAFGGAEAFDDAVELDAVLAGEELLGQPPVFGGDRQPPAMAGAEIGGDVAEVGHGIDIEPDFRNGNDDIGMAEAEAGAEFRAACRLPPGLRARGLRR